MTTDEIFTPLRIGNIELKHRVIMAPLTRYRAPNFTPDELMVKYYSQRATEGGLIISEATNISPTSGIHPNNPRIDTKQSIEGWKLVTSAVHSKGGYIFLQLNHCGRSSVPKYNMNKQPISSSDIKLSGTPLFYEEDGLEFETPKAMDEEDMREVINDFCTSAKNGLLAGFDGIELHSANGYLLDQFIRDNINQRNDIFGGNIQNRIRFVLQVIDQVCDTIGASKLGVRLSPWDNFQDANDSNPLEHFSFLCKELEKRQLAYVHIIEERSESNGGFEKDDEKSASLSSMSLMTSIPPLKSILKNTPIISAGGWNDKNYRGIIAHTNIDALAFGRYFISNPDLVLRLKDGIPLTKYDRDYFYSHLEPKGYIDYPFFT